MPSHKETNSQAPRTQEDQTPGGVLTVCCQDFSYS